MRLVATTAVLLLAAPAFTAPPTTRPGNDAPRQARPDRPDRADREPGGRGMRYLASLRKQVAELDLTAEQQATVQTSMQQLMLDLKTIAEENAGDREAIRDEARPLFMAFRKSLQETLTAEQQTQLREAMQKEAKLRRDNGERPPQRRPQRERPRADDMPRGEKPDDARKSRFLDRLSPEDRGVQVGSSMPEDATVTQGSREVAVTTLLDPARPTLFVFGSLQSKSFAERVNDLPWLVGAVRNSSTERRANLVIVAADSATLDAVKAALNEGRPGVDVVSDDEPQSLRTAVVGGRRVPGDVAILVNGDGQVLARQQWFDPTAVPGMLDANTPNP